MVSGDPWNMTDLVSVETGMPDRGLEDVVPDRTGYVASQLDKDAQDSPITATVCGTT